MSAFGTKRTSLVALHMSAFGGKADMRQNSRDALNTIADAGGHRSAISQSAAARASRARTGERRNKKGFGNFQRYCRVTLNAAARSSTAPQRRRPASAVHQPK